MKTVLFSLLFVISGLASADTTIIPGNYKIDDAHSKVGFEIPHMVISTVDGRFSKYEGEINLKDKLEKSSVKITIDIASIDTGNAKRDGHLKSPDFFDAEKFPTMKFVSKKVEGTADALKITGDLTLHGVTKSVVLDGKYLGHVVNMMGGDTVAFSATTKINRQDYGLKWSKAVEAGPVVGDEVTIKLAVEAGKDAAKAKK